MKYAKATYRLADYALLVLIICLAYWPMSSLQHAPRWDAMEGYFPFRYFLSDSIRHGLLPLWNPYQLGGYPFYGDPQSGFWYPFAWIFGSLAPYNLNLFSLAYLFHLSVAALGCYELTRSFYTGRTAALIAGISFAVGGFFVGNAEHFSWVISAAWLPWVFWAYHRMLQSAQTGYSLLLAIFLYLLLSGGYPAFFIVSCYLLLLFAVCWLLNSFHSQGWKRRIGLHVLTAFVLSGLSVGALLSWMQAMPLSTRSAGMSLTQLNLYPFPPRALISLLTPFASLKDDVFFGTDVVMRNAYVGLLCLLALPFAWPALRRKKVLAFVAILSLVMLVVSFGATLPLRAWLAQCLPGMNRFRFPALFRVFFMLGLILVASQGLQRLIENFELNRKAFVACIGLLALAFAGLLVYSISRHGGHWGWGSWLMHFDSYQHLSTRDENLQLQALLQLVLLALLLGLCLWRKGHWFRSGLLVFFCAADMTMALSLNAFTTVVNEGSLSEITALIATAPHDFPTPDISLPITAFSDEKRGLGELRTNTGIYFKTPQADGYNSFLLKNFAQLDTSMLADSVRANPLFYFASGFITAPEKQLMKDKRIVLVDSTLQHDESSDSIPQKGSLQLMHFLPNDFLLHCNLNAPALLCVQQNFFPGWVLFVDGKPAKIWKLNYGQMGVLLPAGTHDVHGQFEPKGIRAAWYFTWILGLLLGFFLLLFRRRLFGRAITG